MFNVGDIVLIFAPIAGKKKYHLCVKVSDNDKAARFLFMNSDPGFKDTYAVQCSRVPCLAPSATGVTAFSFSLLPSYTDQQLKTHQAKKLGELSLDVAQDLRNFAATVTSITPKDRQIVIAALDEIVARQTAIATSQVGESNADDLGGAIAPAE